MRADTPPVASGAATLANFTGAIDELRLSRTARPDALLLADAVSQGSESRLAVFGADEQQAGKSHFGFIIAAMPLALRFGPTKNSILCAHSLPAPWALEDFDTTILTRDLTPDDLTHRTGSAYRMVWGHSHTPEALQQLADAWNVRLFLLGHEKAESGAETRKPNAVILNSDHERGVVLPIRWGETPTPHECVQQARPLSA